MFRGSPLILRTVSTFGNNLSGRGICASLLGRVVSSRSSTDSGLIGLCCALAAAPLTEVAFSESSRFIETNNGMVTFDTHIEYVDVNIR